MGCRDKTLVDPALELLGVVQAELYGHFDKVEFRCNGDNTATGLMRLQLPPGYTRGLAQILTAQQFLATL